MPQSKLSPMTNLSPMNWALIAFTGFYAAAIALIYIISMFIEFNNSSAMGTVTAMVAAMVAGNIFASKAKRKLTGGERLRFAFLAALIMFAMAFAIVYATFLYYSVPFTLASFAVAIGDKTGKIVSWLPLIFGVAALIQALIAWLGVGVGVKTVLKSQERLADKGQ